MKTKKNLARIFAIFFAMALVLALALPCFADYGTDELNTAFQASIPTAMQSPATQYLLDTYGSQIYSYSYFTGGYASDVLTSLDMHTLGNIDGIVAKYDEVSYVIFVGDQSIFVENGSIVVLVGGNNLTLMFADGTEDENLIGQVIYDLEILSQSSAFGLEVGAIFNSYELPGVGQFNSIDGVSVALLSNNEELTFANNAQRALFGGNTTFVSPTSFHEGYISNTSGGATFVPTAKTGLFGQLYYILKDAIYGSNTILGTSQDFMLTQVAQLLTIATVLLPIIIGVAILVKLLRI